MISFNEYYNNFLGVNIDDISKGAIVFESQYRDKPLNKQYYYPFIITNYYGKLICSVSNKYLEIANEIFDGTEESIYKLVGKLKEEDEGFRVRKMNRFSYSQGKLHGFEAENRNIQEDKDTKNLSGNLQVKNYSGENGNRKPDDILNNRSIPLNYETVKKIKFSKGISLEEYIKRNKELLESEREYIILDDGKMISLAFISDTYEKAGNIVVYTKEEYRGRGYGKDVVKGTVEWCIKNDILPIYLVDINNKPSLNIPIKLPFKHEATEFIISK